MRFVDEFRDGTEVATYVDIGPGYEELLARAAAGPIDEPVTPDDTCIIMYTSGTTGRPKGVVRSHLAETMGAMAMSVDCGFRHDDVILNNKPLFQIGPLDQGWWPDGLLTPPSDERENRMMVLVRLNSVQPM